MPGTDEDDADPASIQICPPLGNIVAIMECPDEIEGTFATFTLQDAENPMFAMEPFDPFLPTDVDGNGNPGSLPIVSIDYFPDGG